MAELKLLDKNTNDNGNEMIHAADKRIPPTECMLKDYHAPEELKLMTLGAMNKMQKDKQRRRKAVMKVVSAAAVMVIGVMMTPLSGCAMSAAEGAYNAMQQWFEETSHIGMKRYDSGCEMELIEERMANQFLYVTFEEDFEKYIAEYKEQYRYWIFNMTKEEYQAFLNSNLYDFEYFYEFEEEYEEYADYADEEGYLAKYFYYDPGITVTISGEIRDSDGNVLTFDEGAVSLDDSREDNVATNDSYQESDELHERVKTYRIYLPELMEFINAGKKYTCNMDVTLSSVNEYGDIEWDITTFHYDFSINNTNSVLTAEEYELDASYTLGNLSLDFQKMIVGQNESNIVAELTPHGKLAEALANKDIRDEFGAWVEVYKETPNIVGNAADYIGKIQSIDSITDVQETARLRNEGRKLILFDNENVTDFYQIDDRYFLVLTYVGWKSGNDGTYSYQNVMDSAGENIFKVLRIRYWYDGYETYFVPYESYDGDVGKYLVRDVYTEFEEITLPGTEEDEREGIPKVCHELTPQEFKLSTNENDSGKSVNQTFTAGDMTFKADMPLMRMFVDWGNITITEARLGDELIFSRDNAVYHIGKMKIQSIVFVSEQDGEMVQMYDDFEFWGIYRDYNNDGTRTNGKAVMDIGCYGYDEADTMSLAYVCYTLKDDNGNETDYVWYDPKYYNSEGVSYEKIREQEESALFATQNTLTVN